jgi:hypothetical protein
MPEYILDGGCCMEPNPRATALGMGALTCKAAKRAVQLQKTTSAAAKTTSAAASAFMFEMRCELGVKPFFSVTKSDPPARGTPQGAVVYVSYTF